MSDWKHNPGSREAVATGCTCPILDNAHGRGRMGLGWDWWINLECPQHGAAPCPVCKED